jgi:hypothetical protein
MSGEAIVLRFKSERQYMAIRFALLVLLFCCSTNYAEEVVKIPLDQIWANNMPGTRNIVDLDIESWFVSHIREALGFPQKDKDAKPAFAVLGTGLDALRAAHEVLVNKKKPRETFPAGNEVSLVFFAHETQPYVHLHKVERQGNNVNIHFRFVPHEEEVTERYIALIPLGKLSLGKYRVNIIRSPMPQNYIDLGFRPMSDEVARRIVCRSFSFSVSEQGE